MAEQELCLNIIPTFANLIDYPSMKNSLIPRIKSACLQTSSLAVSLLQLVPFRLHACAQIQVFFRCLTIVKYQLICQNVTSLKLLIHVWLYVCIFPVHCVGTCELSGVSGEDSGISRQVVRHRWDPALPTTDPLQRTGSTHGHSR